MSLLAYQDCFLVLPGMVYGINYEDLVMEGVQAIQEQTLVQEEHKKPELSWQGV